MKIHLYLDQSKHLYYSIFFFFILHLYYLCLPCQFIKKNIVNLFCRLAKAYQRNFSITRKTTGNATANRMLSERMIKMAGVEEVSFVTASANVIIGLYFKRWHTTRKMYLDFYFIYCPVLLLVCLKVNGKQEDLGELWTCCHKGENCKMYFI